MATRTAAPVRFLGRVALGGAFVALGWDPFLEPGARPARAAALGLPHPELAVTLNGGAMVVAGSAWPVASPPG